MFLSSADITAAAAIATLDLVFLSANNGCTYDSRNEDESDAETRKAAFPSLVALSP